MSILFVPYPGQCWAHLPHCSCGPRCKLWCQGPYCLHARPPPAAPPQCSSYPLLSTTHKALLQNMPLCCRQEAEKIKISLFRAIRASQPAIAASQANLLFLQGGEIILRKCCCWNVRFEWFFLNMFKIQLYKYGGIPALCYEPKCH